MKYTNFNIYIFSTIKKYVNNIISNFIKLPKKVDIKKYYLRLKKNNINNSIKFLNFRYYNPSLLYKYLSLQNYNLYKFFKYLSLRNFNLRFKICLGIHPPTKPRQILNLRGLYC